MPRSRRCLFVAVLLLTPSFAFALDAGDIVRAQKILTVVSKLTTKYHAQSINVPAPTPLTDKSGKYFVPYNAKGEPTEWAVKAFNAQAGAAVGAKVGEKAAGALAAKVPLGGLLAGAAKTKANLSAPMSPSADSSSSNPRPISPSKPSTTTSSIFTSPTPVLRATLNLSRP